MAEFSIAFRNPKYPVIVNVGGLLVAGRTGTQLGKTILSLGLSEDAVHDAVDGSGTAWNLHVESCSPILAPSLSPSRRTKREVIRWFNERTNNPAATSYSEKSLNSKRLDRIIAEIADLLLVDDRASSQQAGKKTRAVAGRECIADSDSGTSVQTQRKSSGSGSRSKSKAPVEISPEDLIQRAHETDDPERQAQLAQQALSIDPDCADAYLVLAELEPLPRKRLPLLQEAVAAERRSIGDKAFRAYRGKFWSIQATRAFMDAMAELADCLQAMDRRDEAVNVFQEMLELNPNDNQGMRYRLLSALIASDRDTDAAGLIGEFAEDESADWAYSRALLAFRAMGDCEASRTLLKEAGEANPHVPAFVTGAAAPPLETDIIVPGDESEAGDYVMGHLRNWKDSPGAVAWMRQTMDVQVKELTDRPPARPTVPWKRLVLDLADLPLNEGEVWHVDVRHLVVTPDNPDESPWAFIVTSPYNEQIVATEVLPEKPTDIEVLQLLAETMIDPGEDDPRRPGKICVRSRRRAVDWRHRFSDVDVDVESDSLKDIDMIVSMMIDSFQQRETATEMPAMAQDELVELPQAAEESWQIEYRRMPIWIGERGTPERPWLILVGNCTDGTLLFQDMVMDDPDEAWLKDTLARAMSVPAVGDARRPGNVAVRKDQMTSDFSDFLDLLNIYGESAPELEMLEAVMEDMTRHMAGEGAPAPLLDAPGVRPEQVGELYELAAGFYSRKPWRTAPPDVPIKLECDLFSTKVWYVMVMGQTGLVHGISLYEDEDLLRDTLAGRDNARQMTALSLQFNEGFDIPPLDLFFLEKYGWKVAGPEAYPAAIRVNPGMSFRPPLAWEIELLKICLAEIPAFLDSDEPVVEHDGLKLSWADF